MIIIKKVCIFVFTIIISCMIDENVLERLKPYLTEVSYPKGYVLFNNEKLERNIYFIKRGGEGICSRLMAGRSRSGSDRRET